MGTGTPAVTVSGITAANAVLEDLGRERYVYDAAIKNQVRIFPPRSRPAPDAQRDPLREKASRCEYCEQPACMIGIPLDIRGINRRLAVGNLAGARKLLRDQDIRPEVLANVQRQCIRSATDQPVEIVAIIEALQSP